MSRHPYGYPDPVPWRDDVARLGEIRAAHPEIELPPHVQFGPWTARIPLSGGMFLEVTADDLGSFCDAFEMHFAPDDGDRIGPSDEDSG